MVDPTMEDSVMIKLRVVGHPFNFHADAIS